jgi:glutathione reductase (NADPH)
MNQQFDLIVLGSGTGARDGANKARTEFGADVALVESTRWGGSCPNVACKPTKAYLVAAEYVHDINAFVAKLGIEAGGGGGGTGGRPVPTWRASRRGRTP